MKTTKKLAVFIAFIALTLTSCSKDDDASPVTFQEENPMSGFLQTSGFNFSKNTSSNPGGESEMGFSFIPKVNGTINALVNKTHVANSNLKVTIWDKVTGLAIATNYVNIANPGVELVTNISPVSLQKNKEYIISVKTQYYYTYQKQNSALQVYPVNSGNITITGSLDGNPNQMPNLAISNSFTGDYSFIFKQTE